MDQPCGGHRLATRPRAAANQQAGFGGFDLQQLALVSVGKNRFDDVLTFRQRCNLVQVGIGRLLGEVLLQIFRSDQGVDETVFDLHGNVIFEMHDQRMKHPPAFAHFQGNSALGTGRFFAQMNDLAGMPMTTGGDFIGNVVHLEQRRLALGLGDKRADALHAHQQTFGGELAQGAVDGHAAEAQLADQFTLRRHAIMRRPVAVEDLLADHLFDAGIQGRRTFVHVGSQRRVGGRSRHRESLQREKMHRLPEFTEQANVCICIYK